MHTPTFYSLTVILLLTLALSLDLRGQSRAMPRSLETRIAEYSSELDRLTSQAKTVFEKEQTRVDRSVCTDAQSNNAKEECLASEFAKTDKYYEDARHAIDAILQLRDPEMTALEWSPYSHRAEQFRIAEQHWRQYRNLQCRVVANGAGGGTIGAEIRPSCLQEVTQNHMHELASIYADLWH